MSSSYKTLSDLTTVNDARNADRNVSDILNDAPFLRVCPADTAPDTTFKYTKYTTAPTPGFRAANAGRDNSKSGDTQVSLDLKILDASFDVDKAIADAYKDGPEAYIAKEAMRQLQAAYFAAEKQVWYGTGNDSGGFAGFGEETDLDNKDDVQVVDATGTTASTGSSVWLVRVTPDLNNVAMIAGKSGQLEIGETTVIQKTDGSSKFYAAYYTPIIAWLGLQRGAVKSVVRICNLTADSGKGLTDALIATALAKFPASAMPTHIVANQRSVFQLRASRTATNATGAPAPIPTEAFGFPIVATDSISSTEALLAANS